MKQQHFVQDYCNSSFTLHTPLLLGFFQGPLLAWLLTDSICVPCINHTPQIDVVCGWGSRRASTSARLGLRNILTTIFVHVHPHVLISLAWKGQIQVNRNIPWMFRGCRDGTGIKNQLNTSTGHSPSILHSYLSHNTSLIAIPKSAKFKYSPSRTSNSKI